MNCCGPTFALFPSHGYFKQRLARDNFANGQRLVEGTDEQTCACRETWKAILTTRGSYLSKQCNGSRVERFH